jgi:hypothetical protein
VVHSSSTASRRLASSAPLRERNSLLLSAGYAPSYSETRLDDPALAAVRTAMEGILAGHEPYPAIIVDRGHMLVSANTAFHRLVEGVDPSLLEPPVNAARLALHPGGLGSRIVNLDEWCWHVIGGLRREATRNPDSRLDALVAELEELVPRRPSHAGPDYLGFAVPMRLRHGDGELRLLTTLTHFGTAVDVTVAELRMEAFLPADAETAQRLKAM